MEILIKEFSIAIITYCLCYLFVMFAIAGDLISGVRKAKKAQRAVTSHGYKRTVDKVAKYYNSLFSVSVIDFFLMMALYVAHKACWFENIPSVPILTIIWGLYLAFTEFRSVIERLEDKDKARMSADMQALSEIIKDKEKFDKIVEIIKDMNDGSKNKE
jgi:hypothetical protein